MLIWVNRHDCGVGRERCYAAAGVRHDDKHDSIALSISFLAATITFSNS